MEPPKRKKVLILFGLLLFLGTAACLSVAWSFRGEWGQPLFVIFLNMCVGVPASLIGAIWVLIGKWLEWKHRAKALGMVFIAVLPITLTTIPSVWIGEYLCARDVEEAKQFCMAMVPQIERYAATKGEFPQDITRFFPEQEVMPRLLKTNLFYFKEKEGSFSFRITDPRQWFAEHVYEHKKGQWTYWQD